jgi:hypothetical protein
MLSDVVVVDSAVVRTHLRPTEAVVERSIDEQNEFRASKGAMSVEQKMMLKRSYIDREIMLANKEADRERKSAFLRELNAEHKEYKERMLKRINACATRASLYVLISQCDAHDEDMRLRAGRGFCNTRVELEYAFNHMSDVIEMRIEKEQLASKSANWPVDAKAIKLEKGGVTVLAIDQKELSYWERQGFKATHIAYKAVRAEVVAR